MAKKGRKMTEKRIYSRKMIKKGQKMIKKWDKNAYKEEIWGHFAQKSIARPRLHGFLSRAKHHHPQQLWMP